LPLLGFHDGGSLGLEGSRGRHRGRAGTAAAGESSGEGQPSRSAGAALSSAPNRQVGLYGFEDGGATKGRWGGNPVGGGSASVSGGQRAEARMGLRRGGGGVSKLSGRKKMESRRLIGGI
jgi:hypothetical protein